MPYTPSSHRLIGRCTHARPTPRRAIKTTSVGKFATSPEPQGSARHMAWIARLRAANLLHLRRPNRRPAVSSRFSSVAAMMAEPPAADPAAADPARADPAATERAVVVLDIVGVLAH